MYLAIAPALFIGSAFIGLRRGGFGVRESLLLAGGAAGVSAVVITETLSLAGLVARWPIAVAWLAFCALAVWLGRTVKPGARPAEDEAGESFDIRVFWGIGGAILLLVLLTALSAAPATWDAMTYHMTRVARWAMQGGVQFYATNDPQQLFQPPLAEYFMLHLYLLAGSDHLVNLVQVLGFGGAAVGASLVARELGASRRGQAFAALTVLTIPQGILQASGAKNDCSVALWLIAMTYAFVRYLRTDARIWLIATGAFLGLAVLTKGTSYVYAPGLLLAAVGAEWAAAKRNWRPICIAIPLLVLALNIGHYGRTFRLFGSPLGNGFADGGKTCAFRNEEMGPRVLWGNLWRNAALHAGTPLPAWNTALQNATEGLIRLAGEDPQNPKALWCGSHFAIPSPISREGEAANPVHMVLSTVCLGWVFFQYRKLDRRGVWYAAGVVAAFGLFCLILRWQPWHTRLHFAWFVFAAPLIAFVGERFGTRLFMAASTAILVLGAVPMALFNQARPLALGASILGTPWTTTLFADGPNFEASYEAVAKKIVASPCRDVAIDTSRLIYLYPLYSLLDPQHTGIRVHEIEVNNETAVLEAGHRNGCAVVCLACSNAAAERYAELEKSGWWPERTGDVVLYSSAAGGIAQHECRVNFEDGWYVREFVGKDWWRFTAKGGKISVIASEAGRIRAAGLLGSVPRGNAVHLKWNGKSLPDLPVDDSAVVDLQLDAIVGKNVLEIESVKPGETRPPDTRVFAFQLRNLKINGAKMGACEIQ